MGMEPVGVHVPLAGSKSSALEILPPFPPGYAFVTVFANGIPSVAGVLDVGLASPQFFSIAKLRGNFRLLFTGTPHASFTVLGGTDLGSRATKWQVLGLATEISTGRYQFTDVAEEEPRRFFRIRWP